MEYANKILHADCLTILPGIEADSADIVMADPPYNIGKDFGNNQDRMPLGEYVSWCSRWIGECMRVLKPSGTFFIHGFPEILAHISVLLPQDKLHWLQWHYTNKNMPTVNFWQRSHESILCVWKDKPIFNRDDVREPYTREFLKGSAGRQRVAGECRLGRNGGRKTEYKAHKNGALPRDVIKASSLAGGTSLKERSIYCKTCQNLIDPAKRKAHLDHELIIHPTQKPRDLTRRLLLSCKPKGPFNVLVPFCGSGTECAEAIKLGGSFISCELNADYIVLAQEVIKKSQNEGAIQSRRTINN